MLGKSSDRLQGLREAWLVRAYEALIPLFAQKGYTVPPCRVSCGFASTGVRAGHIGQCWSSSASADGVTQIFISPTLSDPVQVLDTLVHEMVHAVDDCEHKHGREFRKIATAVGLEGPMRSASAGKDLQSWLSAVAQGLGAYPHAALKMPASRQRLYLRPSAICSQCGFTVPMLKAYLHYGPPICPKDRIEMDAEGDWGE